MDFNSFIYYIILGINFKTNILMINTEKSRPIFPDIFHTGVIKENTTNEEILADGLCGWANCMAGGIAPNNFGCGMAAIGAKLGIIATPDNLDKYYDANK